MDLKNGRNWKGEGDDVPSRMRLVAMILRDASVRLCPTYSTGWRFIVGSSYCIYVQRLYGTLCLSKPCVKRLCKGQNKETRVDD